MDATKTVAVIAADGLTVTPMTFAEFADSIGVDINNLPADEDSAGIAPRLNYIPAPAGIPCAYCGSARCGGYC